MPDTSKPVRFFLPSDGNYIEIGESACVSAVIFDRTGYWTTTTVMRIDTTQEIDGPEVVTEFETKNTIYKLQHPANQAAG